MTLNTLRTDYDHATATATAFEMKSKKALKAWLNKSQFRINFVNVALANVVSQIIVLLSTPILTRLFSPEEFGVAAIFTSLLVVTGSICTWRFDRSVPNASSDKVAISLFIGGMCFLALYSTIVLLIILINPSFLGMLKGVRTLDSLIYFLPLGLIALGFTSLISSWFIRKSKLVPVSIAKVAYSLIYVIACILLALVGMEKLGLILGYVLALWTSLAILAYHAKHVLTIFPGLTLKRIIAPIRNYFSLTSQSALVSFVNTISLNASIILLAQAFSTKEVGVYALMMRLITAPVAAITAGLAVSFWSRAAELARSRQYEQLKSLYKKLVITMGLCSLPVIAGCLLGSYVVVPILGAEWADADNILIALIPMFVGYTLFSSTNHLFVLDHQKYQLVADFGRLLLMCISLALAIKFDWPFVTAVLAMSLSSLFGHVLLFISHIIAYRKFT